MTITTTSTSLPPITITQTNTLPTNPTTPIEPLVFPDQGYISLYGYGYFNFQRIFDLQWVFDPAAGAIIFEGVTFAAHREAPGTTTTGPLAYKLDVRFADGTVEVLQNIGLGNTNNIDIDLTQHEHPKAGVLLTWQDVSGGLRRVMYLLVSEQ